MATAKKIPATTAPASTDQYAKDLVQPIEQPPIRYTEPTPQPPPVKTDEGGGKQQPVPTPAPAPAPTPAPPQPAAPRATGNYEADVLGYLNANFPGARPADLIAAMPALQAMYPGLTQVGDDKIRLPDGRVIDVGLAFGAGGGRGWWWGPDDGSDVGWQAPAAPTSSTSLGGPGGFLPPMKPAAAQAPISTTSSQPISRPAAPQASPLSDMVQKRLMELLSRSTSPSADDPEIALPMGAFRTASQRGAERERADLAERASYEGWGGATSGPFQTGVSGINQRRGESEAQYEAGLYQQAQGQRMQELQTVLALGANVMTQQEQNQIQREITAIQTELEEARLRQNQSQFLSSQQESGRQFDVNASLQQAIEEARLRQQAMEAILRG